MAIAAAASQGYHREVFEKQDRIGYLFPQARGDEAFLKLGGLPVGHGLLEVNGPSLHSAFFRLEAG